MRFFWTKYFIKLIGQQMSNGCLYFVLMMNDSMYFPLVPAAMVMVGMALLLIGPWPIGLPVLVAGTGELVGILWG
tara:strand:- start:173 stop:397 length:225 start_codon:yes stop_codon:yes gene_type:complete